MWDVINYNNKKVLKMQFNTCLLFKDHVVETIVAVRLKKANNVRMFQPKTDAGFSLQI